MTNVHVVTGASGFIGRALCRALESHSVVVRVSRGEIPDGFAGRWICHDLDLGKPSFPEGIDTCFHLAGRAHAVADSQAQEPLYRSTNVDGTRRTLDAAAAAGARAFVLFSSIKVFGDSQQLADRPLAELDVPRPDSPYGRSKLDAEQIALGDPRIPHRVVIRPALVYGPGVKGNLNRMRNAIARGRFPPLEALGNRRSLVHVDDLCSAAILASGDPRAAGRVYHVTDGEVYSTRRIYDALCSAVGRKQARWSMPGIVLRTLAVSGDILGAALGRRASFDSAALHRFRESAWFDSGRIRRELLWKPLNTVESWCTSGGAE